MTEDRQFLQKKVTRRAMHLLERMDRTEQGLRDKLAQSQYPPEMIDAAVEYVKSYGYIDDMRFACSFIRYRLEEKSRQQIMTALRRKGVSQDICAQAWEEVTAEEKPDEKALICRLIQKRCKGQTVLNEKEYRRLQGYLARRGFAWENVNAALNEENIKMEGRE